MLPGHAPFLTTLGIGEVTYRIGRDEHHLAVSGGFAEVRNDKVIMLARHRGAARRDRPGAGRARRGAGRGRLAGRTQEDVDYTRALAALARALSRAPTCTSGPSRVVSVPGPRFMKGSVEVK